jgi:polyhydroxyalkanoate synthase subunit PhaC
MSHLPPLFDPEVWNQEVLAWQRQLLQSIEQVAALREEEIQIGILPKEPIYREEKVTLYHYLPLAGAGEPVAAPSSGPPLLIVYALVNRPYMVDLQPDRSMVRNLLALGVDIYLIDWGYPTSLDRWLTLDDYINGYIDSCVDAVRNHSGAAKVNVLGICQGGAFSLCYAALEPHKVQNLITMVTPVDFHVDDSAGCALLNRWSREMDVDRMVDALGNIPGAVMNFGFLALRPWQLNVGKYLDLVTHAQDREQLLNFMRMEKWIFDSPDLAGEAFREFIRDFYQTNKLIQGSLTIGGRAVDLRHITMPVLNIYAEEDHMVPPASSLALGRYVGSSDYTARGFAAGHIGMYVSRRVQAELAPAIAGWLNARK